MVAFECNSCYHCYYFTVTCIDKLLLLLHLVDKHLIESNIYNNMTFIKVTKYTRYVYHTSKIMHRVQYKQKTVDPMVNKHQKKIVSTLINSRTMFTCLMKIKLMSIFHTEL